MLHKGAPLGTAQLRVQPPGWEFDTGRGGLFTSQKSENVTNEGFFFSFFLESWLLNTYWHTTAYNGQSKRQRNQVSN